MKFITQLRLRITYFFLSVFRHRPSRAELVQDFLQNLPVLNAARKRIQILVHLNCLDKALEVANEIPHRFSRDLAVQQIIKTLLEMDRVEEAKTWIEQIYAEHMRDSSWADIVFHLTRKMKSDEAWTFVRKITDAENRDHVRCEVMNLIFPALHRYKFPDLVSVDYPKWYQRILEVESERRRDCELSLFVECLALRDTRHNGDFSESRSHVHEIVTLEFRFSAWKYIFRCSQSEVDFSSAKELAKQVDEADTTKGIVHYREDPQNAGVYVQVQYPSILILEQCRKT